MILWIEFFVLFEFNYFIDDSWLYWGVILRFARCRESESVVLLLNFLHSEKFVNVGIHVRITLWNHTEDCHIYWFDVLGLLLRDYGELCNLCINSDYIWWFRCFGYRDCYSLNKFSRKWVANQQTCRFCEFLRKRHSTCCFPFSKKMDKAVIVFFALGGIVRTSSMKTCWGLADVSLEAALNCIVECGKSMRRGVVSRTTLLILIKCNPMIVLLFSLLRQSVQQIFCLQSEI